MFQNQRFLTRGVVDRIPFPLQMILWEMIDDLPVEKDSLQVFEIQEEADCLEIHHKQEVPPYEQSLQLRKMDVAQEKIFVIDDGDHSTMLLAEEY